VSHLATLVTYLEMHAPPEREAVAAPRDDLTVVHARRPTVGYYRWLYNSVGAPWLWVDRRQMSDAELVAIIQHPDVDVHVLHVGGVPAGYAELDRRAFPDIELAYFGLIPEFIGMKLGPWLLDWSIAKAWSHSPKRFWLHTQTLDHPKALETYLRLGFRQYKQELLSVEITL
jgi:GNAT superfamily N-acetyltransferase